MYAEYIYVSRYLLICANNPALEGQDHLRNICVCMQNTSMSLGTCSYAQIIQRWKARIILGISVYLCRINPCLKVLAHMCK